MAFVPREPEAFELESNPKAVCPYCGFKDDFSSETFSKGADDGSKATIVCAECDAEYEVILDISYAYTTRKKGGGKSDT
jgi:DNA-directed RNA polymerase subunit RPC12/RpoP